MIVPPKGTHAGYDKAFAAVTEAKNNLDIYLKDLQSKWKISNLKYVTNKKGKFQVEIPKKSIGNVKIPKEFEQTESNKVRYLYTKNRLAKDIYPKISKKWPRSFKTLKKSCRRS